MPYGKDFLETLNGILMDNGVTSGNITERCSQCQRVYSKSPEKFTSDKSQDGFSIYNMCNKCADAKIVNYPDFSLNPDL
tara:strand:- start:230 stop:466 length:237 start_codon:yes stop_codon:yes gene_type:complete